MNSHTSTLSPRSPTSTYWLIKSLAQPSIPGEHLGSTMASTADKFTGRIIITAKGQGDRVEAQLKVIQEYALSDKDPGCFTFRVCRSDNEFFVFEEYENQAAIQAHLDADVFKAFSAEVAKGTFIVGGPRAIFYEEK
ncbi:hypothetical protein RSAG8_02472, partial [Rhizoctonia solani AG-8 WAC10335]